MKFTYKNNFLFLFNLSFQPPQEHERGRLEGQRNWWPSTREIDLLYLEREDTLRHGAQVGCGPKGGGRRAEHLFVIPGRTDRAVIQGRESRV